MTHDANSTACIDGICHRDDRPWYPGADLRRFRNGVAARRRMGPRPDGSCLRFRHHHAFGWLWVTGESHSGVVGADSFSVHLRLDVPEVARYLCCAEDRSCVARLWRACRAFRRSLGFVRKNVGATRWLASRCDYQRETHTHCADILCGVADTDWTLTHRVCASDE